MPENQDTSKINSTNQVKVNTSSIIGKLVILVAIVYALTKWGAPLMDDMVNRFNKSQEANKEQALKDANKNSLVSPELPEAMERSDEDKLKTAIENEINKWIQKQFPETSVTVKFINANEDKSRLAVEYIEKKRADDDRSEVAGGVKLGSNLNSKELLFTRDEFGIYIYKDEAGIRQIRVRQPE